MKVVDYETPGGPDVLQIKDLPIPTVKSNQIMIQVAAAGLNAYDAWCRQGIPFYRYFGAYLGNECSGKVTAVGSYVFEFEEGDEVCATTLEFGGAYAEFVVVPAIAVLRIPSRVSLVQAATLPEASRLTILALSVLKNVTPGKTFLIHGTAGIDVIAIQYFKHIGCEVFVVAGTEEELQLCKTLGAEVCINYRKEDFCKRVKAETGEKGVDIILDGSGRDHFKKNLNCLARGGSLVIFGQKIWSWVDIDLSFLLKKDIRIRGADLHTLGYREMRTLWSEVAEKIWPLIEDGRIKPIIGKTFTFNEAAEAHRALEESSIPGKLLLVPR